MFNGFMLDAYLAGTVIAVLAALVGYFAILRGLTFAAHALPKVGFAGAAGAVLLKADPIIGLAVFAILGALGMGTLGKRGRQDVAVALTLVAALGTGALFLVLVDNYANDAYALLFGQMVGISRGQVLDTVALGAAGIGLLLVMYRPLTFASISKEVAQARGIPVVRIETFFLVVMGVATAVTVPVVGVLLTFSLIVGPAAAASHLTHQPFKVIGLAACLAVGTVWASLALAYITGWPIGFYVATISTLVYGGARLKAFLFQARMSRCQEVSDNADN